MSRGRLSGSGAFLSGAFLAVWAAGALAQEPVEGGTWSFSWVIRSKSCDFSPRLVAQHRAGCFPDMTPIRETATVVVRPGQLPAAPIWPCRLEREQRVQLVRFVASRTNPRRFRMKVTDRAKAIAVFEASCGAPGYPITRYRLHRWSAVVTVSPDGQRVRQRNVLWESFNTGDVRQRFRVTGSMRGRRTGDVPTTAAVGADTGDIPN